MVIISAYELIYNEDEHIFIILASLLSGLGVSIGAGEYF